MIEGDGRVIFHSDKLRNLNENFFTETGEDHALRAAAFARRARGLTLRYGNRVYVRAHVRNRRVEIFITPGA